MFMYRFDAVDAVANSTPHVQNVITHKAVKFTVFPFFGISVSVMVDLLFTGKSGLNTDIFSKHFHCKTCKDGTC